MIDVAAPAAPRALNRSRFRAEHVVTRSAFALIAIHLVDDNFLQPEPGSPTLGHLASGLVPLALIVVSAMLYVRLRSGIRAVLAILCGIVGILAGTEAVYYTASGAASGDDYTGYFSIVGGLVLLGL